MAWGVYILHFDPPYKHARHYIGYSSDVHSRVRAHFRGHGCRLVQVAMDAGVKVTLTWIWYNKSRSFERQLKNQKNGPRLCPICNKQLRTKLFSRRKFRDRISKMEGEFYARKEGVQDSGSARSAAEPEPRSVGVRLREVVF